MICSEQISREMQLRLLAKVIHKFSSNCCIVCAIHDTQQHRRDRTLIDSHADPIQFAQVIHDHSELAAREPCEAADYVLNDGHGHAGVFVRRELPGQGVDNPVC